MNILEGMCWTRREEKSIQNFDREISKEEIEPGIKHIWESNVVPSQTDLREVCGLDLAGSIKGPLARFNECRTGNLVSKKKQRIF